MDHVTWKECTKMQNVPLNLYSSLFCNNSVDPSLFWLTSKWNASLCYSAELYPLHICSYCMLNNLNEELLHQHGKNHLHRKLMMDVANKSATWIISSQKQQFGNILQIPLVKRATCNSVQVRIFYMCTACKHWAWTSLFVSYWFKLLLLLLDINLMRAMILNQNSNMWAEKTRAERC